MRIKSIKMKHVTNAILVVLVGFVILLAISPIIGLRFDTILSPSMSPSMNVGDLVIVTPTSTENLQEGDVIVFHSPLGGGLTCHRIIAIDHVDGSVFYYTQGDANEDPDPFSLVPQDIVGKVQICIPFMGYIVRWLQGPYGLLAIIALGAVVLLMPGKPDKSEKESKKEDVNG